MVAELQAKLEEVSADALAAHRLAAEVTEANSVLNERYEAVGFKVRELIDLEQAQGAGGREMALRERVALLQQEVAHREESERLVSADTERERRVSALRVTPPPSSRVACRSPP